MHGGVLEPDPMLTLHRINAYSGENPRSLVWPPRSSELVFTSSSVVCAMAADGSSQRFFLGHTGAVVSVAFDIEGAIMATAQDGKQAIIRVWDFKTGQCAAILNGEGGRTDLMVEAGESGAEGGHCHL